MNTRNVKNAPLIVGLEDRSYPIYIGEDNLTILVDLLKRLRLHSKVGIVTDSTVGPLFGERVATLVAEAGLRSVTVVLAAGEEHKRLAAIESICGKFLEERLDRSSIVLALGGGVVGDIAGFAAGVFMRGVPFIQIPTTIVAQVDSSVGGKTGVNHPLGKNTIGIFHQPIAVVCDMTLLRSLPDRELVAGMAEAIKHGIIADAKLFQYLEEHAEQIRARIWQALHYPIERSCEIKSAIVTEDEREHGKRANLNYGHTFGHAFEAVTQYQRYLHGEAVSLGMCAAANLGRQLGLVDDAFVLRQRRCLESYGLPVSWAEVPIEKVLDAMQKDKKARAGTLKFIVPLRIGEVAQRVDVPEELVRQALEALRH